MQPILTADSFKLNSGQFQVCLVCASLFDAVKTADLIVNLIDFDMGLQEAGDAPRVRHAGSSQPTGSLMTSGGHVFFESGFKMESIRELAKIGHDMRKTVGGFGGYQAILYDPQRHIYFGASESRKDGQAAGF